MKFITATEAGKKWGISSRRVGVLCNERRIPDAQKVGNTWIIPEDAKKPADARIKSRKYIKAKTTSAVQSDMQRADYETGGTK